MRSRLIDPVPDSVKSLPGERRREVSRTVRAGEPVRRRRDARAAIDLAEWMVGQRDTTYLELLTSTLSLIAIVVLLVLGYVQTRTVLGAIVNLSPWFAVLFLFRLVARWLFRNAEDALEANRDILAGRRPPRGGDS